MSGWPAPRVRPQYSPLPAFWPAQGSAWRTDRDPRFAEAAQFAEANETPWNRDLLMSELSTPGSEDFMKSPDDAAAVIRRMMEQDPRRRYQSMGEVCEDLAILQDE